MVWAIRKEQAISLNDMLFNRCSLGLLGIEEAQVKKVAELMALHLNWSVEQQREQENQVMTRLADTKAALLKQ